MSELLSILFASIFASAMGLNGAVEKGTVERNAKAEIKTGQPGVAEKKMSARHDFKQAEKLANADYKAAIAVCRKNATGKKGCLETAKAINGGAIASAKEKMDKAVVEARVF